MDLREGSGKPSCGIQFPPFLKAAILTAQWQAENVTMAEAPQTFACSLPLSFLCTKQDQMLQQQNETKVTLHLICRTTLT